MKDINNFLIPIRKEQEIIPVDPDKDVELSKSTAAEWVKQEFVKEMPTLLPQLMDAWKDILQNGDNPLSSKVRGAQQVAEALGILQGKGGGVTVNTQINNTNTNNNMTPSSRESLSSIIREMDKKKFDKNDIIDAEIIEPDEK